VEADGAWWGRGEIQRRPFTLAIWPVGKFARRFRGVVTGGSQPQYVVEKHRVARAI